MTDELVECRLWSVPLLVDSSSKCPLEACCFPGVLSPLAISARPAELCKHCFSASGALTVPFGIKAVPSLLLMCLLFLVSIVTAIEWPSAISSSTNESQHMDLDCAKLACLQAYCAMHLVPVTPKMVLFLPGKKCQQGVCLQG